MKKFYKGRHSIVVLTMLLTSMGHAATNTVELNRLSEALKKSETLEKQEALNYAQQNNIPAREVLSNGQVREIQKMFNGVPLYYMTENANAATSTRTEKLWTAPYNMTGTDYNKIAEWDGGGVRTTHQELNGRVTQKDTPGSLSDHSTHVAGTLIASGVEAQAKGMAFDAHLDAYEWNNDNSEMANAAVNGLEISNHSYGFITGWYGSDNWYGDTSVATTEAYFFGFYSTYSRDWDDIAYNAPNYLIVKSAGNDRNDNAPAPGTVHKHNGSGSYTDTHNDDGYDNGGYDTVGTQGVAKNILTVGAVYDVPSYTSAASVTMSSFSGWGPTDDGRIKPDLVGNGIGLYSSLSTGDAAYGSYSGTSMASPNVAGSLALLQQYYQKEHMDMPMRSATLKALVLHTADEAGNNTGPDYEFGWGLMNTEKAAELIKRDKLENLIVETTLNNGETYSRKITLKGNALPALKVTIVWTDPAGTPVAPSLDPADKMLVNDLDIRIVKDGVTYYPWKLDKNNPAAAATRNSKNSVDNVEQVLIDNPTAGTYTIIVDHAGSLASSQNFSMVLSQGSYTKNDFNGDGKADIMWGDYPGLYRIWYMSENGKTGSKWVGKKDGWEVTGINDFDGDGKADILWQRDNGKFVIWLMDENGKKGHIWIGAKEGWYVEEVNDFDGDGKADILWQRADRAHTIWLMDENGKRDVIQLGNKEWIVHGTGDFDKDGKADILWQRDDNKFTIWLMDESGKKGYIWVGVNTSWDVEGVGDFNGDGYADILWDKGDYTFTIWLMDENGKKGYIWIGEKLYWGINSINDFNGDGNADILWKRDDNKFIIWLMDENGKKDHIWIGDKGYWLVMPESFGE